MEIWILLAAIFALQGLDIFTTVRALNRGAIEANKLVAWLMARIGRVPALAVSKLALLAILLAAALYAPSVYLTWVFALIVGGYILVVINNMRHI